MRGVEVMDIFLERSCLKMALPIFAAGIPLCSSCSILATDLCEALGRVPDVVDRCAAEILVKNGIPHVPNVEFPAAYEASEETTGLKPIEMAENGIHPCIRETERGLRAALGRRVRVTVDRPLGTRHPEHRDTVYGLNYGYVADVLAADNEWQDAYVYGVAKPVEFFEGEVVAGESGDELGRVAASSSLRNDYRCLL